MTKREYLETIKTSLINELGKNEKALPKGFNKDRFTLNCISVFNDMLADRKKKENLENVDIQSIVTCLAKGAYLGLDFFNGECYAIPYKGMINFQTDYKGEIKLCKRYSKNSIKDIFAKVVREEDTFTEEIDGGKQNIYFKPLPFSSKPIIGAFAIVVYKDGSMLYDTMSKDDIEKVRNVYSKAKDSQAWRDSTGEMYKKTVLRRLCKLIDLDFDNIEQQQAYREGGDVQFINGQPIYIDGRTVDALPDKGETVDVFSQIDKQEEKEPVAAQGTKSIQEQKEKVQEQHEGESQPPVGSDYLIPDEIEGMDDELPWK